MDALEGMVAGGSDFVLAAQLRAFLRKNPRGSLRDAARALGLSSRTLQRKLRDERTSFQREHGAVRVRVAKDLMIHTDYDLKRIAFEVGCALPQQFSTLFHKRVGETPSGWRERARRERAIAAASDRRNNGWLPPCTYVGEPRR